MEEYIKLEEEKDSRNGKVYNWETATYGRIWDDDEVHNLRSVETEFPAIIFDDTFTSQASLSREPTVSPLNDNEINFRISLDESDDEDYTNRMINLYNLYNDLVKFGDMALPPRDQRHRYLRFEGLEYTYADIADFKERLERLQGLMVIVRDLPMIDMSELVAGGALDIDEGDQAVLAPVQAPQPPTARPARTMAQSVIDLVPLTCVIFEHFIEIIIHSTSLNHPCCGTLPSCLFVVIDDEFKEWAWSCELTSFWPAAATVEIPASLY
nr:hypothetical protein [Tanacetum cinerariifolium]